MVLWQVLWQRDLSFVLGNNNKQERKTNFLRSITLTQPVRSSFFSPLPKNSTFPRGNRCAGTSASEQAPTHRSSGDDGREDMEERVLRQKFEEYVRLIEWMSKLNNISGLLAVLTTLIGKKLNMASSSNHLMQI
jgi:hypothetical protein